MWGIIIVSYDRHITFLILHPSHFLAGSFTSEELLGRWGYVVSVSIYIPQIA
jgi:hypothetical protein